MKCKRCGKDFKNMIVEVCDECGYDFTEDARIGKILDNKQDPDIDEKNKTDLIDYPILSFIFAILGLLIPLFVLSIIAIKLSKKPSKVKYVPFSNLGNIFGILGIVMSGIFISMIIFLFA